MAGVKEIKLRLGAVKNTKKITYAMKLVSAAKLRKAQDSVIRARDYTDAINRLLAELSSSQGGISQESHPLMTRRDTTRRIGLLVVGGNRGLCGAYNTNVYRKIEAFLKEKQKEGLDLSNIDTFILGRKPAEYFRRLKRPTISSLEALSEDANLWPIEDISREIELHFLSGKVDELYIVYTRFKSALSQTALLEKLLPMESGLSTEAQKSNPAVLEGSGVTLFEPSAAEVFTAIIPRIFRSRIRQACLDAKASEHGSRMTAMDSATKNSTDLIRKLTLSYNRLRQLKITSELLDIIGGAEAISS